LSIGGVCGEPSVKTLVVQVEDAEVPDKRIARRSSPLADSPPTRARSNTTGLTSRESADANAGVRSKRANPKVVRPHDRRPRPTASCRQTSPPRSRSLSASVALMARSAIDRGQEERRLRSPAMAPESRHVHLGGHAEERLHGVAEEREVIAPRPAGDVDRRGHSGTLSRELEPDGRSVELRGSQ